MKWLSAEFNSLDDEGRVLVLVEDAGGEVPSVGDRVYLYDDEGNRCQGTLVSVDSGLIRVDADWDSWRTDSAPTEVGAVATVARAHELAPH